MIMNMVKQMAENGEKLSSDEDKAGIMSLAPGVKNWRLRNGVHFGRVSHDRQVTYKLIRLIMMITNILNCLRDLATDLTHGRTCQVFPVCLTVFPLEFRPRTFTIGYYRKSSISSKLMFLECSFPLNVGVIGQFLEIKVLKVLMSQPEQDPYRTHSNWETGSKPR